MRQLILLPAIGATCLLAGCGGGGSGGVSAIPTPPSPAANGEFTPDAASKTISVSQHLTLNATQTATSDRSVELPGTQVQITYDRATDSYSITDGIRSQSFLPSSLSSSQVASQDVTGSKLFKNFAGGGSDYLGIFKAPATVYGITLSYSNYGYWQQNSAAANGTSIKVSYFTFGSPTPLSDMPRTGSATYKAAGSGNLIDDAHIYVVENTANMTADFAAGNVNLTIISSGKDLLQGFITGVPPFNLSTSISSNGFEGPLSAGQVGWAGTIKGQFYGPQAAEVGIVYSATSPTATMTGALVGQKK